MGNLLHEGRTDSGLNTESGTHDRTGANQLSACLGERVEERTRDREKASNEKRDTTSDTVGKERSDERRDNGREVEDGADDACVSELMGLINSPRMSPVGVSNWAFHCGILCNALRSVPS